MTTHSNKSLFIIAFDDIDTFANKGWDVLEVIRKYLAIPNILVVLSGDLDLYSHIVRERQWEIIGTKALQREKERDTALVQEVNDLEDQYLLKLLKPERRVTLSLIGQILAPPSTTTIRIKSASKGIDASIVDFLNEKIEEFFHVPDRDKGLYRTFLLRQPVRTIIQFIRALKSTSASGDGSKAFIDMALGALTRNQIRSDVLQTTDDQDILLVLREMLDRAHLWDAGYRLRPDLRQDDNNLVF